MQVNKLITNVDGLYHREIGFPKNWIDLLPRNFSPFDVKLKYGSHAREEAFSDRYGSIQLPQYLSLKGGGIELFELEIKDGVVVNVVVKMGVRVNHDALNDIVVIFQPRDGFVRTVWLNRKSDSHKTLDASKYRRR